MSEPFTADREPSTANRTIVLDPGHGGHDPGAAYGGVFEKDINLAVASRLRADLLSADPGLRVILTREDDRFIPLLNRAETANNLSADVFLSIHADAALPGPEPNSIHGWSIHYFPGSAPAARLAHCLESGLQRSILTRRPRGLRESDFLVLRRTSMPAALVECGFVSNPEERGWLLSERGRHGLASGLAAGLIQFLRGKE